MKQYINIGIISLFYAMMFVIMGFKLDIETEFTAEEMAEINQEVEDRVRAFTTKEREHCRKELMEKVDAQVDTILMFDIKELLKDDSWVDDTPLRPTPPEKPEVIHPQDSTPLQPLIENEDLIFDE